MDLSYTFPRFGLAKYMDITRLIFYSLVALPLAAIEPCQLLIAARALGDPNFSKTVVLVVEVRKTGVLGLVLNRPLPNVPISRVFAGAKKVSDPVYYGGPVERGGMVGLSRDSNAKTVCGDIALVTEQKQLSKALDLYSGSSGLRIYSGYAGWGKGQLEKEIEIGGWLLKPFQSSAVYDSKPTTLWDRFLASMETMLARRA